MSGFYIMYRGWQDNPIFDDEPYTQREAWEWLISNAAWRDTKTRILGQFSTLKRGQLSYSIRFLADKWGWLPAKAQRYLLRLKADTMIDTSNDTGQLIITISNYSKYQADNDKPDTAKDTENDTAAIQQRYKEEQLNNLIKDITPNLFGEDSSKKEPPRTRVPLLLPDGWSIWASNEFGWDKKIVLDAWDGFVDYWQGIKGEKGKKSNWQATWKNNCRSSRIQKNNQFHKIKETERSRVGTL